MSNDRRGVVVRLCRALGFGGVGLALMLSAVAKELPLWELGVGVGALRLPHYRGSDQSRNWLLPLPYLVYRGNVVKTDRNGARAVVYKTDRFNLDVSIAVSAPTRSRDNEARRGMANLPPSFEIGPNAKWTLSRGAGWKLDLRAPLRAVMTLESRPRAIGWTATPNVNLDLDKLGGWNVGLHAGPVFGTRRLHSTYYDVAPSEATATRPAYRAAGGSAGSQFVMSLSRRFESHWAGLFLRYDSLRGARFVDSPLVRQRELVSVGVAFSWALITSERMVATAQ